MGFAPKSNVTSLSKSPDTKLDAEKAALKQSRAEAMGLGNFKASNSRATSQPATQIAPVQAKTVSTTGTEAIPSVSVNPENIALKTICTKIIRAKVNIEEKMLAAIKMDGGKPIITQL